MHLHIKEEKFAVSFNAEQEDVQIYYDNINADVLKKDFFVINGYVCLFDDNYKIIDEVFEYLQSRQNAKMLAFNSIIAMGQDLKLFYDFLAQFNLPYSTITNKHINDFIAWLMTPDPKQSEFYLNMPSRRSAKSINRIVSTIKDFYFYHQMFNNIQNPFEFGFEIIKRPIGHNKTFFEHTQNSYVQKSIFKIKEFKKGIRVLSREQLETIFNACKRNRDRLLFEFLALTGVRIGEALSLNINDIGISNNSCVAQNIKMRPNENDYSKGRSQRQQKTGTRDLFIPTSLMNKLSAYYDEIWMKIYDKAQMEHDYFFISESHKHLGNPLSYQAVWKICREIGIATGIMFTPHDFRHTYATSLARNNIGIEKLKKLLGHSHMSSTLVYVQIASKEDIVQELIPFYEKYGVDI